MTSRTLVFLEALSSSAAEFCMCLSQWASASAPSRALTSSTRRLPSGRNIHVLAGYFDGEVVRGPHVGLLGVKAGGGSGKRIGLINHVEAGAAL